MPGTPRTIQREKHHVDPFADVGRVRFNLGQFLADMVYDAVGPSAGTERPLRELTLPLKVCAEVERALRLPRLAPRWEACGRL